MKLILIAAVITVASAQVPSRNYIPQGSGGHGSGQFHSSGEFGGHQSAQSGGFGGSGGHGTGNTRSQQAQESKAAVVQQSQEISESGSYHFSYETENGIRAEEAGNPGDAQGGFSYKGDDGHTYTITYTSGEGGFRPQGEHLPVAPATPQAILEALAKNAQDEAAGIFDDGLYRPDIHGGPSGHFGGNGGRRPSFGGNGGQGGHGGQGGQGGFGGHGNAGQGSHQNGFNSKSGYTY